MVRLRLLALGLLVLAALAVPAAGQEQGCPREDPYCNGPAPSEEPSPRQREPERRPGGGSPGGVPRASRFCGQGGDPAAPGNGVDPRGVSPSSPNPLAGLNLYVNKIQDDAYRDMVSYQRRGRQRNAELMARIADRPRGVWFGKFTRPNFTAKVRNFLNCAQWMQPGSVPIMVVLRHQGKQCNPRYKAGGRAEDRATMRWYDAFRRAVGNARVIVAFEPDSIGTISCLARSRRAARRRVLRYGVDQLSKLPNATIYLEATASDWKSPAYSARLLRYIGIHKVRGFMVNVTHFDWTSKSIRYGHRISRQVGGRPFVVSTSYNGRGPVHYKARNGRRVNVFCNVRYRGLGPPPTTTTGFHKVDAFLWLNRPGISGAGSCNGAPPNGRWWPARALMFARYATDWIRPPRGTRFGFRNPPSLCRLGAPVGARYKSSAPERRCKR